ncbi:hypothetical protein [Pseudomonas coleopterorum]|jgi:hypothetical protein|uniref:Uncharacterized protein n=1 Tax=Pseudomonas coleopterorum TaxID=1605838 RepID=A0AAJ6MUX9_9PSED|nr:hypothetical protein [Pseudomonas coleopterorum]WNC11143.1 hypothetical protein RI108_06945 [Pseudomonas coleopterorum]
MSMAAFYSNGWPSCVIAGQFAEDLFVALDFKKMVIRDRAVARGMVFSLCIPLAKKPAQAGKLKVWLRRFVKEGSLAQPQADAFWLRAKKLAKSPG